MFLPKRRQQTVEEDEFEFSEPTEPNYESDRSNSDDDSEFETAETDNNNNSNTNASSRDKDSASLMSESDLNTVTVKCTAMCCTADSPYQPSSVDFSSTKRKQGRQNRSFVSKWFRDYCWLSFCTTRSKVFCFFCQQEYNLHVDHSTVKCEPSFTSQGFDNWKRAKDRFKKHEKSRYHVNAFMSYKSKQQPSISTQLSLQHSNEQEEHRFQLLKQLTSLHFLLHQGLPVRGHIEEDINLYQLLKCRSEDSYIIKEWLEKSNYRSPEIINELIQLIGNQLLRLLVNDIRLAGYFSIIADETRDLSGKEQLSLCIRWVDGSYKIHEDFIGFAQVDSTDADTLASTIKDILLRITLPISKCVGQAYYGASNMSGRIRGVCQKILRENPKAIYIHCLAQTLNLCLQESSHLCKPLNEALSLTSEIATFICASPKRLAIFELLQKDFTINDPLSIKPLCPTRWTVHTAAIKSILSNYSVLRAELEIISRDSCVEAARKACGLLAMMDKFSVYFGLKLAHIIFAATEQVSKVLQKAEITAQEATGIVNQAIHFLTGQRTEESFTSFYTSVVEESKDLTDAPVLPRQRRIPARYNDGGTNHTFSTPEELHRKE